MHFFGWTAEAVRKTGIKHGTELPASKLKLNLLSTEENLHIIEEQLTEPQCVKCLMFDPGFGINSLPNVNSATSKSESRIPYASHTQTLLPLIHIHAALA